MVITLNGQAREHNNNTLSVAALLEKEGYADKKIAIAINGQFIPKSAYNAHIINQNDEIEIVAPMQGG